MYRAWSDDRPAPAGMNRFDLAGIFAKEGKLESYRSDRPIGGGSRFGPQNMVGCGRALQMLAAWPGLWEERYREQFKQDHLVRFTDDSPRIDGQLETVYGEPTAVSATIKIALVAQNSALYLAGEFEGEQATITLFSKPDGQGRRASLLLQNDGTLIAQGEKEAPLQAESKFMPADSATRFEARVPFMIQKTQGPWWTGIEHGRYSVSSGGATRNFYLLSSEQRVKRKLHEELAVGLANWRNIYREQGYIPSGLDRLHSVGTAKADDLSDSGGYAHLIAAAAQYPLYLDGRRDWNQQ